MLYKRECACLIDIVSAASLTLFSCLRHHECIMDSVLMLVPIFHRLAVPQRSALVDLCRLLNLGPGYNTNVSIPRVVTG